MLEMRRKLAKTSGTVCTKDREKNWPIADWCWPRINPTNNCRTYFGSYPSRVRGNKTLRQTELLVVLSMMFIKKDSTFVTSVLVKQPHTNNFLWFSGLCSTYLSLYPLQVKVKFKSNCFDLGWFSFSLLS